MNTNIPTALYDIIAGDEIIYVGSTSNPKTRFQYHKMKWLPPDAELKVLRWYPTRAKAEKAETARIKKLKPCLNIRDVHKKPYQGTIDELRKPVIARLISKYVERDAVRGKKAADEFAEMWRKWKEKEATT